MDILIKSRQTPPVTALIRLLLSLAIFLPASAQAGYENDTCKKNSPRNRVRADIVFDLQSGKILLERNARASFHPASLSKLMALAVVFDHVRAGDYALADRVRLVRTAGERDGRTSAIDAMTVREAILGVATGSLNNALDGLAAKTGTVDFVADMNGKAAAWGLSHTRFVNPTGWPTPQSIAFQRTTLRDYAQLVRQMWSAYPAEMKQISGLREIRIAGLKNPLKSTNNLLETADAPRAQPYDGVVGGKTGYTCYSGWHLAALYEDRALKNRRMMVISVGHKTGAERDRRVRELLDVTRPRLKTYVREEERQARLRAEAEARKLAAQRQAEREARRREELRLQQEKSYERTANDR